MKEEKIDNKTKGTRFLICGIIFLGISTVLPSAFWISGFFIPYDRLPEPINTIVNLFGYFVCCFPAIGSIVGIVLADYGFKLRKTPDILPKVISNENAPPVSK
jgi:hypothetical protein